MGDGSLSGTSSVDSPAPVSVPVTKVIASSPLTSFAGLLLPLVTIVGLIVLLALKDIDQTAAVGLIAAIAGVHGGAAVASATA